MRTYNKNFTIVILFVFLIMFNTTLIEAQTQGTFGSGLTWCTAYAELAVFQAS